MRNCSAKKAIRAVRASSRPSVARRYRKKKRSRPPTHWFSIVCGPWQTVQAVGMTWLAREKRQKGEKAEKNTVLIRRRSGAQKLREAYTPTKLRSRRGWSYTVLPPQKAA